MVLAHFYDKVKQLNFKQLVFFGEDHNTPAKWLLLSFPSYHRTFFSKWSCHRNAVSTSTKSSTTTWLLNGPCSEIIFIINFQGQ